MSQQTILKVENISKQYRLGNVGTGTLSHDLNRWWHQIRGKENPYAKVGAVNDRSATATQDYVWAIKNINFEVKKGEVLGIIGKNGAGKSTLLKILSRVTSPTTGSIKTKGRIASLLEVGTGFHPELTGKENIYLNGAILGMNKAEINSKIDEIIEFSGCQMYIDTPVKRYSSGMRVRLAFAVAAFLEPDILVIDEVLAVGDAEFQKKAIGKMQDISKGDGRTVIFVSHNMAAVKKLCTRAIVLENGISVFEGDQNEAVDYYLSSEKIKEINSLKSRTDRKGSMALKFTNISFFDEQNHLLEKVQTNQYLKIFLEYDLNDGDLIEKFIVSIIIYDLNQQMVASFPSDEFTFENFNKSKTSLYLEIPKFNIRPGKYVLSIYSFNNAATPSNYIDTINHVVKFEVLPIKYDKKGKSIRSGNMAFVEAKYSQ